MITSFHRDSDNHSYGHMHSGYAHVKVLKMAEEFDLLPLEGSKSGVWSYFGFPAKEGKFLEKNKNKRKHIYCKVY